MRIDSLRSFVQLVEAGSYTAASESLFMSVTTLHSHVKAIEDELNAKLVTFTGRRLELTHAGSLFLIFAKRALEDYEQVRAQMSGLSRQPETYLRVVSLHGPGNHLLPPVVRAFHRYRPDLHVIINTRRAGECIAALAAAEADLAIVHDVHDTHARGVFDVSPLLEDDLVLVVRDAYYQKPDMCLLEAYPFALQPNPALSRQYVERWAQSEGISLDRAYEHSSFDGILSHVLAEPCIGVVGSYAVRLSPFAHMLRTLDIPSFSFRRRIVAIHSTRPPGIVREFVGFFAAFYAEEPALEIRQDRSLSS